MIKLSLKNLWCFRLYGFVFFVIVDHLSLCSCKIDPPDSVGDGG